MGLKQTDRPLNIGIYMYIPSSDDVFFDQLYNTARRSTYNENYLPCPIINFIMYYVYTFYIIPAY